MRITIAVLLALLAVLYPIPCFTQETTGNLEGQIVDEAGQVVPLAGITVTSPSLQGTREHVAAPDGYFGIFNLPVGVYTVRILHISYHEVTYENVPIRLGRTTNLGEIRLTPKAFEIPEVVIKEERPLIDPTSTAIGATLYTEQFGDLPIDRNYRNIPVLLPHANESFLGDEVNFAGSTGQENKYFIDGVETTDPYLCLTGTNLPYNFIKDIEVREGGYEAEYRSSLGAIVNAVSRSGGNEFHGQAFGFFVSNQFAGDSRTGVTEPRTGDFAQYDVGLSLGGPIAQDRLWFFAAYNPSFSTEDMEIPGTGFHEDKGIRHIVAGKIHWRTTDKTNLNFTIIGDPGKREAVGEIFGSAGIPTLFLNPDPFLVDLTTGGVSLLATGAHTLSDKLFLEASVSGITRTLKYEGSTERARDEILFVDEETGIWSGGYPTPTDDYSVQVTAGVTGTIILGRHMLKSGLEYRDNRLDFNEQFKSLSRMGDSLYTQVVFSALGGTVRNRIPSAFVQDSWRITDRMRVNAGLRWDGQFLVGTDGKVAQRITDQFQPRIGFVYQPGKLGSQKIFGSFGRFYQELGLALSILKHNENAVFELTEYDHDPRVDPTGGAVFAEVGTIQSEVENLKGQHYDEFTLGYERQLGSGLTIGTRGIYRTLREGIEDGFVDDLGDFVYGNPGKGALSDYPKMKREYTALELTLQTFDNARYSLRASYVVSKTYGNYPGLFDSDMGIVFSNVASGFDVLDQAQNSTGLLPNDRTHVLKLSGAYRTEFGLTGGTSFTWQSGTPLSVYEPSSVAIWPRFAQGRGTAGRTPSIWDLNFRFAYDLARVVHMEIQPRLILDVFHVGSQREPVAFKEAVISEQGQTTPFIATRYQPPTAVRLGMEVDF